MDNKDFWTQRVEKYGHTNWADLSIFAFDQPLRSKVINYLKEQYSTSFKGGVILDFGCGEGDHVKAIAGDYKNIILFDPCKAVLEKAMDNVPGYTKAYDSYEQLFLEKSQYSTILSITVLQHILIDGELNKVLDYFNKQMTEDGIIILMESFYKDLSSEYIRKWNYSEFEQFIKDAGFTIAAAYNFYTPEQSREFQAYRSRFSVKWLLRMHYHLHLNVTRLLMKIAEKYNNDFNKFLFSFT